ncbi:hypothetical protein EPO44_07515 [bacterium]|nr:MAG: hypothetical protein EPO44_07515 [bacterium]
MFLADIAKVLLPGIVIAVLSAWITVRLAIRRFHQERWWEKKEAAYSSLLEVLHRFKRYASQHYDRELGHHDPSDEDKAALEAEWQKTDREYERLRDLASLHLSGEAISILDEYEKRKHEAQNEDDFLLWIEGDLAAATDCLEKLKRAAKKDLKVG